MDHRAALILAASLFCGTSHAYYAQLSAPAGWSQGAGAVATYNTAKTAAQVASVELGRIAANAALTVNGKTIPVPAKLPLGPGAARVAAAAIYLHPGLRAAAAVATWIGAAGLAYNVATGLWEKIDSTIPQSDGYEYYGVDSWHPDKDSACRAKVASWGPSPNGIVVRWTYDGIKNGHCAYSGYDKDGMRRDSGSIATAPRPSSCPSGWYHTSAGCVQNPPMKPVTQEEFEQMVPDARPMPPELPGVVWPASWPVEVPEIQPMFIPTGNPVKNPAYDPAKPTSPDNQPWLQPGVKLSPAPTPSSPWNVDLQPVNRPVESPNPNPDPVVDPVPNPEGSGDADKPRDPEKDERDLCEKYPDIIACQKLEAPEDNVKLPVKEVDFNFAPESGYAGSAVCPPPIVVSVAGETISISWQPFCDSLSMIRPMMLAMAWLMAAFILIGRR